MENLTQQLNEQQLKANIDALLKAGKDTSTVQSYVNNYSKDTSGNYVLKNTQKPTEAKAASNGLIPALDKNYQAPVSVSSLFNTVKQGGQNVIQDIKNIPQNAQQAGGQTTAGKALDTGLAVLQGAGHIAGDIAGTAGGLIGDVIAPLLPQAISSKVGNAAQFINDKVNSIPGMTPEIAKGLGDVFNTASLLGGNEATPVVKQVGNEISNATNVIGGNLGDVAGQAARKVSSLAEGKFSQTPSTIDSYIDKNYAKAIPSTAKRTLAGGETQILNNREAVKTILDNKTNLEYSSPNGGIYDSGKLPTNLVEHGQAIIQTMNNLWDKQVSLLRDKKVFVSLKDALSQIPSKMKELGPSSSEYPYLQKMYEKYSKTPMASSDQINNFISDLNNDAKPYFQSGSDAAKAKVAASVGNLFRKSLDITAQQVGSPEISLLRRQYGALASTEKDIARAINKQLKSNGAGGVSGLADLFSGEEIARGIITGHPASIITGASTQAAKWFLKWVRSPDRYIKNLYSNLEKVSQKGELSRMASPYSTEQKAGLPVIKGNPNTAKTPPVINMGGKVGIQDEAQAKNIGAGYRKNAIIKPTTTIKPIKENISSTIPKTVKKSSVLKNKK